MTTIPVTKLHTIAYAIDKLAREDTLFPEFDITEYPGINACLAAVKDPSLRTVRLGAYSRRTLFQEACKLVHRYSYSNTGSAWALMIASATWTNR